MATNPQPSSAQREPPPTILVHAEESHAPLLARLATETFSDTFGTQCNSADLASHIATSYNVDTLRREIASEHVYFLCLASDPRAVDPLGFCQFHLARSPLLSSDDAADPCWSVHRFYLRRGAQGLGVAVPMMQFVLQRMREERARTVWLFVHSENLRAKRFYAKFGFGASGKVRDVFVGNRVDQLFMARLEAIDKRS